MNPIPLTTLLATNDPHQPETHQLIPNLLPLGLTILYGQPRVGTSWLTLHLALSIALGEPVLDHFPTNQTSVLYLGLQDTPHRMCTRTRQLLANRPTPLNFTWTNSWRSSPSETDPIAALDLWLTAHPHTRLLVIDSLQHLSPSPSMLTPHHEYTLISQLKTLADHHHIAILLTAHLTPKSNTSPRDPQPALSALADTILVLTREYGQPDATLLVTGTDLPDADLALRLPPQTLSWTLIGPATDYRLSQERQDILTLLQEHRDGPLRPKEIATLLHKDVRAVTKLLFSMSHANQIRLLGRGHYMTIQSTTPTDPQPPPSYLSLFGNNGNLSNEIQKHIEPIASLLSNNGNLSDEIQDIEKRR